MKTKLLYSALIASCLVALSSCDPNDWNDKLDGFDGDKGITNKQMIAYTFTDADYTNLAANSANIKQAGDTLSKELKAVGTQHYFTDKITARDYIPNFLSDSDFAYFTLSDGSSINITYRVAGNVPEEVTNFGAAGIHCHRDRLSGCLGQRKGLHRGFLAYRIGTETHSFDSLC